MSSKVQFLSTKRAANICVKSARSIQKDFARKKGMEHCAKREAWQR